MQYGGKKVFQVPTYEARRLREKSSRYGLVIPVVNEGERIRRQLRRLKDLMPGFGVEPLDLIIADGGSSDGSLDEAFLREQGVAGLLTMTGAGGLSAQLRMAAELRGQLDRLAMRLAGLEERPSVLFLLSISSGRGPLAAGSKTSAAGIIELLQQDAPDSGALSAGSGGLEISLGLSGSASSAAGAVKTQALEALETSENLPVVEAAAPAVERTALEAVEEVKQTESALLSSQESLVEMKGDILEPEAPEDIGITEASPMKTLAPAPDPPSKLPPEKPAANKAAASERPAPVAGEGDSEGEELEGRGEIGTGQAASAGTAASVSGGGDPGAEADYFDLLRAWLERHKHYPKKVERRRMQGMAMLYLALDSRGQVLDFRLQQSSGHELLDEEVLEMLQRAQPLPELPEELKQARLEVVIPVQFHLR